MWGKEIKMQYFTPRRFPSLEVGYYAEKGQSPTFDDPGYPDEIEFTGIDCNGDRVDPELESHLIETFYEEWEDEIKGLHFD